MFFTSVPPKPTEVHIVTSCCRLWLPVFIRSGMKPVRFHSSGGGVVSDEQFPGTERDNVGSKVVYEYCGGSALLHQSVASVRSIYCFQLPVIPHLLPPFELHNAYNWPTVPTPRFESQVVIGIA